MPSTCSKCSANITETRFPGVQCSGSCQNWFHVKCITVSGNFNDSLACGSFAWTCQNCKSNNKRTLNVGASKNNIVPSTFTNASFEDVQKGINDLCNRFKSFEDSQLFISNTFDGLRNDVKSALDEIRMLKAHVNKTEEECRDLRQRCNYLESLCDESLREKIKCNIVLNGIPTNNYDSKELVGKILSHVHPEIRNEDIVSVFKPVKKNNHNLNIATQIYIVKLSSMDIKTAVLTKMKLLKTLTTDILGIKFNTHSPSRIHILHHLSSLQSRLYNEAKIIKQQLKFRFLWIKNGTIMLRKDDSSRFHHIRTFDSIDHIRRLHAT